MTHFLGIDVGTSGTKALVVDDEGEVVGVGNGHHDPKVPRGGWSEQDPEDWKDEPKIAEMVSFAMNDQGYSEG